MALIAVLALALPGSASAALGDTEEFIAPTQPTKPLTLAEGPDGNVWYTNSESTKIGKVTPSGEVTEYSPGLAGNAYSITAGPDGDVWFTETGSGKVGHIDPSEPTTSLVEIAVPNLPTLATSASFITAGPDGNLWVTLGNKGVARITPAGVVSEFAQGNGLNASANVCSIIAGPDGNVWFGDCAGTRAVGKVTPAGAITEFTVTGGLTNRPHSIALGSDERIWFAAQGPNPTEERIGAITTTGTVTYYPTGLGGNGAGAALNGFASGADGNVWARETFSANERQALTIKSTAPDLGGTYKLSFLGDETDPIPYNAAGVTIEEELGDLPSIGGVANVEVLDGTTTEATVARTVVFEGKFARADVSLLSCNGAELTGTAVTCTLEQTTAALPQRLYRIKPNGEFTVFPLEPQTLGVTLTSTGKMGTLAPGPNNSLWFTTTGDPGFASTPAIGEFDLGIVAHELKVVKEGSGDGTVVSDPAGIECDPTCSADFKEGEKVTLTASHDSDSLFVSWKGCETGGAIGRTCKVTMDKAKTVTAKFTKAFDVSVERKGTGLGKVASSPGGILCLANCDESTVAFKEGASVTLTATPSKYFTFAGWSGDCAGTGTCALGVLSADAEVEAEFVEVAKHLLTVTKSGGGEGSVKTKPSGVSCGTTCSSMAAAYYQGTAVEVTVTAGKGSTFGGWSTGAGTCTGTTNPCTVTVNAATPLTAEFK